MLHPRLCASADISLGCKPSVNQIITTVPPLLAANPLIFALTVSVTNSITYIYQTHTLILDALILVVHPPNPRSILPNPRNAVPNPTNMFLNNRENFLMSMQHMTS